MMKSLRLNKEMRQNIVKAFLEKREKVNPRPEVTVDRTGLKTIAANKVQQKLYGEYEGLIPDELVFMAEAVKVQLPSGSIDYMYFGEDDDGRRVRKMTTKHSKVEYVFTEDDPIYKEYKSCLEEYKSQRDALDSWQKDHDLYKSQVEQVVNAVNTTRQLVEVWPESEQFIPNDIRDPSSIQLPAISIDALNSQI